MKPAFASMTLKVTFIHLSLYSAGKEDEVEQRWSQSALPCLVALLKFLRDLIFNCCSNPGFSNIMYQYKHEKLKSWELQVLKTLKTIQLVCKGSLGISTVVFYHVWSSNFFHGKHKTSFQNLHSWVPIWPSLSETLESIILQLFEVIFRHAKLSSSI